MQSLKRKAVLKRILVRCVFLETVDLNIIVISADYELKGLYNKNSDLRQMKR